MDINIKYVPGIVVRWWENTHAPAINLHCHGRGRCSPCDRGNLVLAVIKQ